MGFLHRPLRLFPSASTAVMGSTNLQFYPMGFDHPPEIRKPLSCPMVMVSHSRPKFRLGMRNGSRKPLWRKKRVLSTEAIQAVQSLKLAKSSSDKLEEVFSGRLSRLLKADLLDTLVELQRQNEVHLALKEISAPHITLPMPKMRKVSLSCRIQVFQFVRTEVWYEPDTYLFSDIIMMLGKNKLIEMAEELFSELKKEGLEPNTRAYCEMIGAYFKMNMIQKAMETYELMKASGCVPDKLTLTILIKNLEKSGKEELAAQVKKECTYYVDSPEKFLEEVGRKYSKQKSLDLV